MKMSAVTSRRIGPASYLGVVYIFLYLPLAVLIAYSFNDTRYSMLWQGFTFKWYQLLFEDSSLWIAAGHSLLLGLIASVSATAMGTLAAVSLYRYRFLGRQVLHGLIFVIILTPEIVMGISLLLLYTLADIPLGFWTLLFAHVTFCMPFVVVTVYGRILGLDKNIFEAAKDLGASEFTIFWRIVIPLLWPAIIAGWLLSFTLSFDDVVVSYFVSGPSFEILPLQIFSMARLGVKPELNALCSILFILTLVLVGTSQLVLRKK